MLEWKNKLKNKISDLFEHKMIFGSLYILNIVLQYIYLHYTTLH